VTIDTLRLWLAKFEWKWDGREKDWLSLRDELIVKADNYGGETHRIIGEAHDNVTGWHIKMYDPGRLCIQGSVSRLVNGRDFTRPTDERSVDQIKDYLKSLKSNRGLNFDPDSMRLGRVDVAGNYRPSLGPDSFLSELGRIGSVQRMKQQVDPNHYSAPYARWGNSQNEFVFYQKGQGRVRSEYRMMTTASCERNGFQVLNDLRDIPRLTATWREPNEALLQQARTQGLCTEKTAQYWGMAPGVAALLKTPNARVTEFLQTIARPGIEAFLREIGGENHLESWTSSLRIPPYRKKRFLDHLCLCGAPSHGKSCFADNFLYVNSIQGSMRTLYLSLEVPKDIVAAKILSRHSYELGEQDAIPYTSIMHGQADGDRLRELKGDLKDKLQNVRLLDASDNIPFYPPTDFGVFLERQFAKEPFDILILDYLQVLKSDCRIVGYEYEFMNRIVSMIRRKTVSIGGDNRIISLILSQVNREGYKGASKPDRKGRTKGGYTLLSSIAESNELERSSQLVLFLYLNDDLRASNEIKYQLLKNRDGRLIATSEVTRIDPRYSFMGVSQLYENVFSNEALSGIISDDQDFVRDSFLGETKSSSISVNQTQTGAAKADTAEAETIDYDELFKK
jgi:hypothetical protein